VPPPTPDPPPDHHYQIIPTGTTSARSTSAEVLLVLELIDVLEVTVLVKGLLWEEPVTKNVITD